METTTIYICYFACIGLACAIYFGVTKINGRRSKTGVPKMENPPAPPPIRREMPPKEYTFTRMRFFNSVDYTNAAVLLHTGPFTGKIAGFSAKAMVLLISDNMPPNAHYGLSQEYKTIKRGIISGYAGPMANLGIPPYQQPYVSPGTNPYDLTNPLNPLSPLSPLNPMYNDEPVRSADWEASPAVNNDYTPPAQDYTPPTNDSYSPPDTNYSSPSDTTSYDSGGGSFNTD